MPPCPLPTQALQHGCMGAPRAAASRGVPVCGKRRTRGTGKRPDPPTRLRGLTTGRFHAAFSPTKTRHLLFFRATANVRQFRHFVFHGRPPLLPWLPKHWRICASRFGRRPLPWCYSTERRGSRRRRGEARFLIGTSSFVRSEVGGAPARRGMVLGYRPCDQRAASGR
jgi:hypothetical protein